MNTGDIFDSNVDNDWYNSNYSSVKGDGISAQDHYNLLGRKAGLYPNGFVATIMQISNRVDREWYRTEYIDVKDSGLDPYFHFAVFGQMEGRFANAKEKVAKQNYFTRLERDAALFDEEFYINKYPDVANASLDPFDHYIRFGRDEGRAPNAKLLHQKIHAEYRPYISMIYNILLGRPATNDELVAWTMKLISGIGHYDMLMYIASSGEAKAYRFQINNRMRLMST